MIVAYKYLAWAVLLIFGIAGGRARLVARHEIALSLQHWRGSPWLLEHEARCPRATAITADHLDGGGRGRWPGTRDNCSHVLDPLPELTCAGASGRHRLIALFGSGTLDVLFSLRILLTRLCHRT